MTVTSTSCLDGIAVRCAGALPNRGAYSSHTKLDHRTRASRARRFYNTADKRTGTEHIHERPNNAAACANGRSYPPHYNPGSGDFLRIFRLVSSSSLCRERKGVGSQPFYGLGGLPLRLTRQGHLHVRIFGKTKTVRSRGLYIRALLCRQQGRAKRNKYEGTMSGTTEKSSPLLTIAVSEAHAA